MKESRIMSESNVSLRQLRRRFSHYLNLVRAGQTVTITDHDMPICHIVPISQSIDARLNTLCELGLIQWNGKQLQR